MSAVPQLKDHATSYGIRGYTGSSPPQHEKTPAEIARAVEEHQARMRAAAARLDSERKGGKKRRTRKSRKSRKSKKSRKSRRHKK
jgi:hypothetical protein